MMDKGKMRIYWCLALAMVAFGCGDARLVMIGDSITEGWHRNGSEVWDAHYRKYNAVNLGHRGDTTSRVLERIKAGELNGLHPKLVVLLVGTNDTSDTDSPEEIAYGVKAIVDLVSVRLPETKILVLAIFPRGPNHGEDVSKVIRDANGFISRLADNERVFYLDITNRLPVSKEIMPDSLHLSPKGYEIWAQAMEPTIQKLILGPVARQPHQPDADRVSGNQNRMPIKMPAKTETETKMLPHLQPMLPAIFGSPNESSHMVGTTGQSRIRRGTA